MSSNPKSTHHLSTSFLHVPEDVVNSPRVIPAGHTASEAALNEREDRFLRIGNGIRDEVVFPRLREMGVDEADLHRIAMRLVRLVQYGLDIDGSIANFLDVIRLATPAHGTISASEVV